MYWRKHWLCALNSALTLSTEQSTDSVKWTEHWEYVLNRALRVCAEQNTVCNEQSTGNTECCTVPNKSLKYSAKLSTDRIYWAEHWQYILNRVLTVYTEQSTDRIYWTQHCSIYGIEHCHTVLNRALTDKQSVLQYWTQHWQFCSVLCVLHSTLRATQCAVQSVTEQFHLLEISAVIRVLTPGGSKINGRPWHILATILNNNYSWNFPLSFSIFETC
jgi:hypothetical protein